MKIYVASSWRNTTQPAVVELLRRHGHDVYDFKNPDGKTGFAWSDIDPNWQQWTNEQFRAALQHPVALRGFSADYRAMLQADLGVLVLPSGRSAHTEAGYFNGAGKGLIILLGEAQEPELMYNMASAVVSNLDELTEAVDAYARVSCPF